MLYQLVYASERTEAFNSEQVDALLAQARRNNGLRDLTGLLVFDSRSFLQVLEGERETLSRLYSRLVVDPRHTNLVIVSAGPIDARQFSAWAMGYAAADASRKAIYLRHGASSNFEPKTLTPAKAMALLEDFAQLSSPGAPAAG